MSSSNKGWIWGVLGLALVLAFWKFFVAIAVVAIIALIAYGVGLSTAGKNSDDETETGVKEISAPSQNLMLPPAQPHYHPHPQSQYEYGNPNAPLYPQGIPFDQGRREQGWIDPHSPGSYPQY